MKKVSMLSSVRPNGVCRVFRTAGIIAVLLLAAFCCMGSAGAQDVVIYTPEDLKSIGTIENLSGNHTLAGDIALTGNWNPIGNLTSPFNGTFNGAGFNITGLTITSDAAYAGLFGYVNGTNASSPSGVKIHNLTVEAGAISVSNNTLPAVSAGVLIGYLDNKTTVENITIKASSVTVTTGNLSADTVGRAGGMIGWASDPAMTGTPQSVNISNCYVQVGLVKVDSQAGSPYAGGVVGDMTAVMQPGPSSLVKCAFSGGVEAVSYLRNTAAGLLPTKVNAGGIAGSTSGNISYCSAAGTVKASVIPGSLNDKEPKPKAIAGGLAGSTVNADVEYSHSDNTVTAVNSAFGSDFYNAYAGGIVGEAGNPVRYCSATGDVTATAYDYAFAAGIVAKSELGVENCSSTDNLIKAVSTNRDANVGGIVSFQDNAVNTTSCYVTSQLEAITKEEQNYDVYVGGILGQYVPEIYDPTNATYLDNGTKTNYVYYGNNSNYTYYIKQNSSLWDMPGAASQDTSIINCVALSVGITAKAGGPYAGGVASGLVHRMDNSRIPSSSLTTINSHPLISSSYNGTASTVTDFTADSGNWIGFLDTYWQRSASQHSKFNIYLPVLKPGSQPTPGTYGNKGIHPTYTVGIDDKMEHGSVEATPTSATPGTPIQLNNTPDSGYALSAYNITTQSGKKILPDLLDRFIMPGENVTVNATFLPAANITVKYTANGEVNTTYYGKRTTIADGYNLTVFKGDSVTFDITPFEGYTTQSVGINGTKIASTNTSYTFVNVRDPCSINATFVTAPVDEPSDPVNVTTNIIANPGNVLKGAVVALNSSDAQNTIVTINVTTTPQKEYGPLPDGVKPLLILKLSSTNQPQTAQAWITLNISKTSVSDPKSIRVYHNVYDGTNKRWKQAEVAGLTFTDIGSEYQCRFLTPSFSYFTVTVPVPPVGGSSGNTENAFRVLFDATGGSFVSPATGLSYGDRITEPAAPVKDGYTFGGWYKNEACTIQWIFKEDAVPGDITLYAKWTSSDGTAPAPSATATATTAPAETKAAGTAVATAAPSAAASVAVQPSLTQAPAPIAGTLLGLLGLALFLRRRP